MKRSVCVCVIALMMMGVGSGCNAYRRQPRLTSATITPAQLQPGDTAVITVTVERDRFNIVDKVSAVVREDPRMKFDLKDDGTPPDEEAGDGVWSLLVDVPFMAPPGDFTLELTGYDEDGNVIPVLGPEGGEMPLSTTCVFSVEHPLAEDNEQETSDHQPSEDE
ncbi:MAG: choice-of-anchor X domain-containing protein [Candidatus Hydrogenedentota bacterium]